MNRACFLALAAIGCGASSETTVGPPFIPPSTGGTVTNINLSRDAGAAQGQAASGSGDAGAATTGAVATGQGREYGVGDYAVILTSPTPPPRICWYTLVTTRVCDGSPPSKTTSFDDACLDSGRDCLAQQPEDRVQETASCRTHLDVTTVSGDALAGTCATLAAYHRNYLTGACMFHKHCPGGKCVDYQCTGANYHPPGAPGGGPGGSPGGSTDAGPSRRDPDPLPDAGATPDALTFGPAPPDAGAPDALTFGPPPPGPSPVTPDPTPPPPPDASPPPQPMAPGGPGGPAPPMGR